MPQTTAAQILVLMIATLARRRGRRPVPVAIPITSAEEARRAACLHVNMPAPSRGIASCKQRTGIPTEEYSYSCGREQGAHCFTATRRPRSVQENSCACKRVRVKLIRWFIPCV
ncbi:hypothetical protein C8Q78DRAFT_72482 [Trametes maxima]|nr:hypothetical protein C8Q78DRAFT_72482 [Trametes maxima]